VSLWTKLESQLINLRTFRPFFPVGRTLADMLMLPAQMARHGGRANAFPFAININVTTRCNLRCPYCFNEDNNVARSDEIGIKRFQELAAAWAPRRPGVFISGGEPFARADLVEIVEAFKGAGLPVGIVTNGTLATEEQLRRLAEVGLDVLMVSIHGQRETHDRAVGVPGSFDKSMATLRFWSGLAGAPTPMANFVLTAESVSELSAFVAEADSIRPLALRLSHLNFLTAKEIAAQREYWEKRFPDVPIDILSHQYEPESGLFAPLIEFLQSEAGHKVITKPVLDAGEVRQWYGPDAKLGRRCVFIWRSTFINAQGDVYPCQFLYVKMGNIRKQPLEEIWNNELYRRFRETLREGLMPGCARCCKI